MFSRHWKAAALTGLLSLLSISSAAHAQTQTVDCTGYPQWNSSTIYQPGDRVVYQGSLYEALVSIWSADPAWGTASGWYKLVGPCAPSGNQAPSVSLTAPSSGSSYQSGSSILVSANASDPDGTIARVQFFSNGTSLGTDTTSPYQVSWTPSSTGTFSLTAVATDNAGLSTTSSAVSVTLTSQPPPPPPDGSWHPNYLAIGTVYEPFTGTDGFFAKVNPRFPTGKRIHYGYLYLNGGSQFSEWHSRADRLARKSLEQGMTPIYVVYGIGGNSDSAAAVWSNLQSASFLSQYFQGLRDVGQTATAIMGSGRIGYVIEPDTLGYIQQQYASQYNNDPSRMPAATYAAYDSGVLQRGVDPDFPNTLTGLVQSINYTLRKYTPKAFLGWQLNLWAAPGAPSNGIMHATEVYGFETGKLRIQDNARANAGFAQKAGVQSRADFISIDKYGLDGAGANGANPSDPASSLWFWNADLWNNYLLWARTVKETLLLPIVLWQIPVGHINGTTRPSPTVYNASGRFPDLNNTVQHYEESASPFFFGDTLTLSGNRLSYFSRNVWSDPKVSVSGSTVTWGAHTQEAANAGIVAILMGAGVGVSTRAIPQPGSYPESEPTENYYWITRVQEYLANPTLLP
jgi:chitodextrinase